MDMTFDHRDDLTDKEYKEFSDAAKFFHESRIKATRCIPARYMLIPPVGTPVSATSARIVRSLVRDLTKNSVERTRGEIDHFMTIVETSAKERLEELHALVFSRNCAYREELVSQLEGHHGLKNFFLGSPSSHGGCSDANGEDLVYTRPHSFHE